MSEAVKGDGDVDTWMGHYKGRLGPALGVFAPLVNFYYFCNFLRWLWMS